MGVPSLSDLAVNGTLNTTNQPTVFNIIMITVYSVVMKIIDNFISYNVIINIYSGPLDAEKALLWTIPNALLTFQVILTAVELMTSGLSISTTLPFSCERTRFLS